MAFSLQLAPEAIGHLKRLPARDRVTVTQAIRVHLAQEPLIETRNRKPMRPNTLAPWELRVGVFRVYYDVEVEPEPTVVVVAIGMKRRGCVRIGGEEFES